MSMSEAHVSDTHLPVAHQFEDEEQQFQSYSLGMWVFLAQELLFFGGLFTAFIVYRHLYFDAFVAAHHKLDWKLGGLNTLILLTSSLTMALGVRTAIRNNYKATIGWLLATCALAFGFMGVKYVEYSSKFAHNLWPAGDFVFKQEGIDAGGAQIFYGLYFTMTGLHGLHVLVGILIMGWLVFRIYFKRKEVVDYIPIELTGLYWHFVDLVWIFLFPLLYLIG
jgi:cytochrome c oxidase subunit 3